MIEHSNLTQIDERYRTALQAYLCDREEVALLDAYELGRRALNDGFGVLDMAVIHAGATAHLAAPKTADAEVFFVEALSPFEMAQRAFRDTNTMLRRLNDVLDGQAKRIAYALHNEAGQLLASMHFALAEAGRNLPEENRGQLTSVRTLLVEMEYRLRNLSHELRPPVLDDLGLTAALALLADTVTKRWGLQVVVRVTLQSDLPSAIETTIYRIVQEALNNVAKHANADVAEVSLRVRGSTIVCSIRDDGAGFDNPDALRKHGPGLGLTEIRERVDALCGTMRIAPNGESGTDLTIEIPLEA